MTPLASLNQNLRRQNYDCQIQGKVFYLITEGNKNSLIDETVWKSRKRLKKSSKSGF